MLAINFCHFPQKSDFPKPTWTSLSKRAPEILRSCSSSGISVIELGRNLGFYIELASSGLPENNKNMIISAAVVSRRASDGAKKITRPHSSAAWQSEGS